MNDTVHTALIATADNEWREQCTQAFLDCGCDIHTVSSGEDALDLLRKQSYEYLAVDDSLPDVSPLEFGLSARDIAVNRPQILVGLKRLSALAKLAPYCNIVFTGPREKMLSAIADVAKVASAATRAQQTGP